MRSLIVALCAALVLTGLTACQATTESGRRPAVSAGESAHQNALPKTIAEFREALAGEWVGEGLHYPLHGGATPIPFGFTASIRADGQAEIYSYGPLGSFLYPGPVVIVGQEVALKLGGGEYRHFKYSVEDRVPTLRASFRLNSGPTEEIIFRRVKS